MTNPKIPLAAVIGSPISHTKSPLLHTYWLNQLGINGFYIPIDVAPCNLEEILRNMPKMGFVGANITIPHKERVLLLADEVSDRASIIGAANTLSFTHDGKIYADPVQFPDKIGTRTVELILSYFNGEEVPAEVLIPTELYRQKNGLQDASLQ